MAVHDKFLAIAQRLIKKHGRPVTFIALNETPADPLYPFEGPVVPQVSPPRSLSTIGCFVEPDSLQRLGISTKLDQLLQRSDRIMLVPGPDDLAGYHEVVDEGQHFKIVEPVETLKPGLTILLHFVGTYR